MAVTVSGSGKIGGAVLTGVPAFKVYSTLPGAGAQVVVSSGVRFDITHPIVALDTHSWYNTSNGRYTPQIAGWYWFDHHGLVDVASGALVTAGYLLKNGADLSRTWQITTSAGVFAAGAGVMAYMNGSTDYVTVAASIAGTTPRYWNDGAFSYFEGFLVKADP